MKGETYTAQVVDELTALAAAERSRADRLEQDLERLRTAIQQLHFGGGPLEDWCQHCGFGWPCPTSRLLASVEENRDG